MLFNSPKKHMGYTEGNIHTDTVIAQNKQLRKVIKRLFE